MKYTPHELNQMRRWIADEIGRFADAENVERRLVTYMANGTTAAELEAHARTRQDEDERKRQWHEAARRWNIENDPEALRQYVRSFVVPGEVMYQSGPRIPLINRVIDVVLEIERGREPRSYEQVTHTGQKRRRF